MLVTILIVTFLLFYQLDFVNLKKKQSKGQNGLYLFFFLISFCLLMAYVLNIPLPKVSTVLRNFIHK